MYANYPDVAVTEVSYKNLSDSELDLDEEYSNAYSLDASRANPESKPYDFWSFQGASLAWGLDYILPISDGFEQENWMGVQPETLDRRGSSPGGPLDPIHRNSHCSPGNKAPTALFSGTG